MSCVVVEEIDAVDKTNFRKLDQSTSSFSQTDTFRDRRVMARFTLRVNLPKVETG